jgi:predicted phage tail protein
MMELHPIKVGQLVETSKRFARRLLTIGENRFELLLAESELSRARLSEEWRTMAHGAGGLARRAATVGAWASSAALLVAGVAALRRGPRAAGAAKSAWFPMILKGVRLASAIWQGFHARGERPF